MLRATTKIYILKQCLSLSAQVFHGCGLVEVRSKECQGIKCLDMIKNLTLKIRGQVINGTATMTNLCTVRKSLVTLQVEFQLWTQQELRKCFQSTHLIVKIGIAQKH